MANAPIMALANTLAMRLMALLTPDAVPE
jgi:hypothetical protein